jgi:hypothetical protein
MYWATLTRGPTEHLTKAKYQSIQVEFEVVIES